MCDNLRSLINGGQTNFIHTPFQSGGSGGERIMTCNKRDWPFLLPAISKNSSISLTQAVSRTCRLQTSFDWINPFASKVKRVGITHEAVKPEPGWLVFVEPTRSPRREHVGSYGLRHKNIIVGSGVRILNCTK